MSEARTALETVRRLVEAMAPPPMLCTTREIGDTYVRGWDAARTRALELIDAARAAHVVQEHQWVQAIGTDAETGERSLLPYMVCTSCRRRSDVPATIGCAPLTPEEAAQWAEADAAFAEAQQSMAARRHAERG